MFELFRRTNRLKQHGFTTKIQTAEDVYHYFVDELQEKKKEHYSKLIVSLLSLYIIIQAGIVRRVKKMRK